ncbi:acyltransferase family protein [Alkalicoccus daliensis]|uniref:Membrane-bound acyltransferase YfiQ, involved in biofilm formation n=1 Tax=Alkalicoccus daliensis TaxID=745820 RepID=A0A1H0AIH8_9BACI|nr:acyltransferase family protein [Alkalicoccus daliensis]SDN33309.1 Membrane-bound acyltransferase YfiQ, involved in biofilm formation [Alkalicoccus daliensis]
MIKEIFILRSIGCLSIVLLHSIHIGIETMTIREMGELAAIFFDSIQMILYYGTPMFIFISEFLIAYSYRTRPLPDYFLKKRLRYILIPFFVMGILYALPFFFQGMEQGFTKIALNIFIGDYHGYFILIIFQFYLFHYLFHSYLKRWKPQLVLTIAFIINAGYLMFFNFTLPPENLPYGTYIWERFYWVPMLGWVFYFAVGYYAGTYYEMFSKLIYKYRYIIIIGPVITSMLMLTFYHSGFLTVHSSKRTDILVHTIMCSFFLFYLTSRLKHLPPFLELISRYSFGIYLLHYIYIFFLDAMFQLQPVSIGFMYIIVLFFFSLFASIGTIIIVNKWKYGYLIIGQVGVPFQPAKKPASQNVK